MSDNYILLLKGKYNVKEQSGVSGQKDMQDEKMIASLANETWFSFE